MAVKIDFNADTKNAVKSISQLKGSVEQLKKAANASMSAGSMKTVQQNIDATTKKVQGLRKQYEQFQKDLDTLSKRSGTRATKGNYSKLISTEMAKSKEALKTWEKELKEYSNPKFANNKSIQGALERTKGHISYEKRNQELLGALKTRLDKSAGTNLTSDIKSAERELSGYNKQADAIAKANEKMRESFAKVGTSAVGALVASLKSVGSALASASAKVVSFTTSMQKGFVKMIPSAIKLASKFGNAVTKHFSTTFAILKRMGRTVITRLTRRAIMMLFSGFTEGMQNLARYSKDAMAAMSSFSTSSLYLKNQLAATFSPVLNAVAAAFEFIANSAAAAMQAISRFLALIGGKSSYTKAVRYNVDYADSLNKAGGGAGELKNQLLGFDKINRLDDNKGGGGGKLYSPEEALEMFETVDIQETLADMYDLGAKLANSIADSLARIPWDKIRQKSQDIGNGIVNYINGALSSGKLAIGIGKTVAEAFKLIVGFNYKMGYEIEWNKLGKNVGDAINTALGNISEADWKKWGYTLVGKLHMAFDFLAGLVTETDFESVGNAMVNAISGAVEALFSKTRTMSVINPKKPIPIALDDDSVIVGNNDSVTRSNTSIALSIVDFVTGAINGAAEMLEDVSTSDLLTVGGHIQDYIIEAIEKIDWHLVGDAISGGFKLIWTNVTEYLDFDDSEKTEIANSLSTTINTILENLKTVDWSKGVEVVTDGIDILTETVNGIDSDSLAEVIGNILTAAINGAGDLISSFVELGKAVGGKVIGAIQSWWSGDGKGETISAIQGLFTSDDGSLDVGKIGLIALTLSGFNVINGTSLLGMLKTVIIGFLGLKALSGGDGDGEGSGEIDIGSVGKIALTVLGFNLLTKNGGTLLSLLTSNIMSALGVSGSGLLTAGAEGLLLTVSVVLADSATKGFGGWMDANAENITEFLSSVGDGVNEFINRVTGGKWGGGRHDINKQLEEKTGIDVEERMKQAANAAFHEAGKELEKDGLWETLRKYILGDDSPISSPNLEKDMFGENGVPSDGKPKQVEGDSDFNKSAKIGDTTEADGKKYAWDGKEWTPIETAPTQKAEPEHFSHVQPQTDDKKQTYYFGEKGLTMFGEIDVLLQNLKPHIVGIGKKNEKKPYVAPEHSAQAEEDIKKQIEALKSEAQTPVTKKGDANPIYSVPYDVYKAYVKSGRGKDKELAEAYFGKMSEEAYKAYTDMTKSYNEFILTRQSSPEKKDARDKTIEAYDRFIALLNQNDSGADSAKREDNFDAELPQILKPVEDINTSVSDVESDVHIVAQSNKVNNQNGGTYVPMTNKVNTAGAYNGTKKISGLVESMMGSMSNILTIDEMNALVTRISTLKSAVQSLKDAVGSGGRISVGVSNRLGSTISNTFKNMLNAFIDSINNDAVSKVNDMIDKLRQNQYTGTVMSSVSRLSKIPKLAQGAVIPANNEFLAILGDQKQGTNVEAPLDTIVEAMMLALGSSGMTASAIATAVKQGMKGMSFKVDGRAIGRVVADNINSNRVAEGKLPLNL